MITYLQNLWNKFLGDETTGVNTEKTIDGTSGVNPGKIIDVNSGRVGALPLPNKKSYTLQNKFNKKNLAVMVLVGVLLIVIAMPTGSTSNSDSQGQQNTSTTTAAQFLDEDYKTRMEMEVEGLLAFVEGVGNVNVMITLATSSQKVVEKDKSTSDLDWEEHTIYGEDSYGQNPYVNQEIYPEVAGVVVAAQGGDNPVVVKNITEAIQALFAVDTHKIKIMKMKIDS